MSNPPPTAELDIADDVRSYARATWRGVGARVWPVAAIAAFCYFCFSAFRAALLVASRGKITDATAGDIARCLQTGFLYDGVPVAWLLLPLILMVMLPSSRRLNGRWFRRVVAGYLTFVIASVVVLETIGTAFFLHFGVRLNLVAIEYLSNAREIIGHIWVSYPAWTVPLALVVGVPLLYWLCARRLLWRHPAVPVPVAVRWPMTLAMVALCAGANLGWSIRYPLDMGTVYSRVIMHTLICEAARNNAYTLGHAAIASLYDDEDELSLYPFPPREEAFAVTAGLLFQDGDQPLNSPKNPLWRRVDNGPARPYNVVIIVMEGMTGPNVGCMGSADSASPNLDRLAAEGLFFDRCYAVGDRTNRGLVGTLCGFPDIGGPSVLKQARARGLFLTLPGLFRQRGYHTSFIYGGNPTFDNMNTFLSAGGVQDIIAEREIAERGKTKPATCWGLVDEVTLEHAHEEFLAHGSRPFFAVILTVSNHEPFDMPLDGAGLEDSDDFEVKKRNGIAYADYALGKFFAQARTAGYFQNTLFVLVADHGRYFQREHLIDIEGFRVPFIVYGPELRITGGLPAIPPRRVSTVCSQADIGPTLLGLMGGVYEHCFMGRDILRADPDSGFALLHEGERLAFVTARDAVMIAPNRTQNRAPSHASHYVALDANGMVTPATATTRSAESSAETDPAAEDRQARIDELTHHLLSFYRTALDLYFSRAYGSQALE